MHNEISTMVLANWKAYLSPSRALQWCDDFIGAYRPAAGVEVIIAVPFLSIREVAAHLDGLEGVSLAAQSVSTYPQGSYTGSTPAAWLENTAQYALLGHRERRRYFKETSQEVARQVQEAFAENLQPIVCVDKENATAQTALFDTEDLSRIIWAYTPPDADQLERAHEPATIAQAIPGIRKKIAHQNLLYGGGVNAENARQISELEGITGIMVGSASLDASAFAALLSTL